MVPSSPLRPHIALPYAVLGAAGGWMAADFFRVGVLSLDAGLRPALLAVTPLAALVLGLLLNPITRWPRGRAAFATVVGVLGAGLTAGGLVGVLIWSRHGVGEGAASGFWCAAAFLPGFAAVLAAARRVGRARPGSLVDGADRRAIWLAVAAAVALGTLAALPDWYVFPGSARPSLAVSRSLGVVAVALIAAVLLRDLVALARALRATREIRSMRSCAPDDPNLSWARRQLDLGVGHEAAAAVIPAAGVYREHDRVLQVIRGNPEHAGRAMRGAVAWGAAALACGVACLLATLEPPMTGSMKPGVASAQATVVHEEPSLAVR